LLNNSCWVVQAFVLRSAFCMKKAYCRSFRLVEFTILFLKY
jgi:hypothetical protein